MVVKFVKVFAVLQELVAKTSSTTQVRRMRRPNGDRPYPTLPEDGAGRVPVWAQEMQRMPSRKNHLGSFRRSRRAIFRGI